jgi:hypothetical protein
MIGKIVKRNKMKINVFKHLIKGNGAEINY